MDLIIAFLYIMCLSFFYQTSYTPYYYYKYLPIGICMTSPQKKNKINNWL